jgi:hypothetical protein
MVRPALDLLRSAVDVDETWSAVRKERLKVRQNENETLVVKEKQK